MTLVFKTHYNVKDFPKKFEILSDKKVVETAGYITAQQRIENIMDAGYRLQASRMMKYDYESEDKIDPDFYDPTRSKNFDMADGTQIANELNNRFAQEKALQKSKKAQKVESEKVSSGDKPDDIKE